MKRDELISALKVLKAKHNLNSINELSDKMAIPVGRLRSFMAGRIVEYSDIQNAYDKLSEYKINVDTEPVTSQDSEITKTISKSLDLLTDKNLRGAGQQRKDALEQGYDLLNKNIKKQNKVISKNAVAIFLQMQELEKIVNDILVNLPQEAEDDDAIQTLIQDTFEPLKEALSKKMGDMMIDIVEKLEQINELAADLPMKKKK